MRPFAVAASLALAVAACQGSAFDSDPSAWSPLATPLDGSTTGPDEGEIVFDARCRPEPPYDESIVISTAGAVSHASGEPCLEGCHEPGGSARSAFVVGGTVFRAQRSKVVAESGSVFVGGTRLDVDACGNIYAKEGLTGKVAGTPPYIATPTRRRMDKTLSGVKNPGSCNQSTCHDFSSRLRWGIYF